MPNHVTTILEAPAEVLEALRGEDRIVDFNRVIQMPGILQGFNPTEQVVDRVHAAVGHHRGLGSKSTELNDVFDSIRAGNVWRTITTPVEPKDIDLVIHGIRAFKETGFAYWYDWACENWGTKWNAYDAEERGPGLVKFETAWSFPEPVFLRLSEMFPDHPFVAKFADEDMGHNCGWWSFVGGDMRFTKPKDPLEFAFDVHGLPDEERKEIRSYHK